MDSVHETVKEAYARTAKKKEGVVAPSCCGPDLSADLGKTLGYSEEDLTGPAAVGNLGVGCGNPTALAELKEGEVVVDLGSGAGFDALLAAPQLGSNGRFIGVDMTPEMLGRARKNAVEAGFEQTVEFREGLIEELPIASNSVDVIISNCVINLSPDKARVFKEAARVLKSGGRLAVSDIVLTAPLPKELTESKVGWSACVSGAILLDEYIDLMKEAGFEDITYTTVPAAGLLGALVDDPLMNDVVQEFGTAKIEGVAASVVSASIKGTKK